MSAAPALVHAASVHALVHAAPAAVGAVRADGVMEWEYDFFELEQPR